MAWITYQGGESKELKSFEIEDEFPVFKVKFPESRNQKLERWGREHKELSMRQQKYVEHSLAKVFQECLDKVDLTESLADKFFVLDIDEKFDELLSTWAGHGLLSFLTFKSDWINVGSDAQATLLVSRVKYRFNSSFTDHEFILSNKSVTPWPTNIS